MSRFSFCCRHKRVRAGAVRTVVMGLAEASTGFETKPESSMLTPRPANFAANMLGTNMAYLADRFPKFNPDQLLQATAASYNLGAHKFTGNPNTIDVGSAGNNYGSNVAAIANNCF